MHVDVDDSHSFQVVMAQGVHRSHGHVVEDAEPAAHLHATKHHDSSRSKMVTIFHHERGVQFGASVLIRPPVHGTSSLALLDAVKCHHVPCHRNE